MHSSYSSHSYSCVKISKNSKSRNQIVMVITRSWSRNQITMVILVIITKSSNSDLRKLCLCQLNSGRIPSIFDMILKNFEKTAPVSIFPFLSFIISDAARTAMGNSIVQYVVHSFFFS